MINALIAKAAAYVGIRPKVMVWALAAGVTFGVAGTIYIQHLKIRALTGEIKAYRLADVIAEEYAKQVSERAVRRRAVDGKRYENYRKEALNEQGENNPVGPRSDRAYRLLRGEVAGSEGQ